ncbi:hypothetical protein CR105_24550 [Massilia eurypsychrophila]|uniref:Uncharacterized protein n=1 Tax=Massilia eurypsychrophila TaxID=1485217 RepID=A0A2G8T8P9_9BURK|nr:hypothetical protein [Massilia eurypsychrophila]PIL42359.1 hypothetical protein CR105_24550 [Massilia eurypsychrophila]
MTARATAPAGNEKGSALDVAHDAMNASDLGMSILDEMHTIFKTIEASAQVSDLSQDQMLARLRTIERFARLAAHFADERMETFSFYRDQAHEVVAALRAAS